MRVFHFLKKEYALQALEKQRLKVALIDELNDPFELLAADLSNEVERCRFLDWKNEISKRIGFLCFSKNTRNPLLWSHYADRHRGVALELEVSNTLVVPVRYCRKRLKLDIPAIMKNGGFPETLAEQLGSTKSIHWYYEDEVRVAIHLADCQSENNLLFEQLGNELNVVGIIAGPLCTLDTDELKSIMPKGKEVVLHHTRIAFRSFEVVKNKAKPSAIIKANG